MGPLLLLSLLAATAPAPAAAKPVISVLYFDNNTGKSELDVMRKGLADMIVTDLVTWDGVTVVERDRLEQVLAELKLQSTKAFDAATAVKVGKLMGAQFTLMGSMQQAGTTLRLDARLVSADGGAVVGAASVSGDKDKIFDLEQELVLKVTAQIDGSAKDPARRKKSKVPDLEALVAYSKAIDLSDQGKLDEARAAMTALVSKSPAFLMARERKQQLLEQLKDFEKRRKDLTTDAVLQLGALADQVLASKAKLDSLDEKAQARFLGMRVVKAHVMMRIIKQFLSSRREHLRIPLKGKEAQALALMRTWAENQRHLVDEYQRYVDQRGPLVNGVRFPPSSGKELDPETLKLFGDARLGNPTVVRDHFIDLVMFVLLGRATDSDDGYTLAPALGDLDPAEQKAAFAALDEKIAAALAAYPKTPPAQQLQVENQIVTLIELEADALLRLDRDEDAIGALQKILDTLPQSRGATRAERTIKILLGAERDNSRASQERWARAITQCEDMDIRVGMSTLDRKVRRMGLAALAVQAAELEKGCKPTPKNRGAFAYLYKDLALEAAYHEDCDAFRSWFTKYLESDGSRADMLGYQKNYTPWCELGEIVKSVSWFTAMLDGHWTLECDRTQTSTLSYDKKTLTLLGTSSPPRSTVSLRLEARGSTFECVRADLTGGSTLGTGTTCAVTFTSMAKQKGDFDEGTFSATLTSKPGPGMNPRIELTDGKFRVRRQ